MRKSTRQDLILYYDAMTITHNLFIITQDKAEGELALLAKDFGDIGSDE